MNSTAKTIWSGLEFRKAMLLRNVEPLTDEQMHWIPGPERVCVAWQLWHIAEVEDNWIRSLVTSEPLRFPFGMQMRQAKREQYPSKDALIGYLDEVRAITRDRLESTEEAEFDRAIEDVDFGPCTVRDLWMGVVTSFAWHAGQVALTAKLIPQTPVTTLKFGYWQEKKWNVERSKS